MLTSIQHLVNKLKEKEKELEELHRKEKMRADEAERLNSYIVENLGDGLILWSPYGKLLTLNASAEKIFNVPRLVALNQTYLQLFEENDSLISLFNSAFQKKEKIGPKELEFKFKEGKKIILETTILPLFDKNNRFIGLLSIFKDITEEKRLKEIARTREELALIGELSAGIVHEFRNSLGVILGHSRLLEKEIKENPYLQKIRKETDFLLEMVEKFLSFAKPLDLKKEKLNIEEIIEETFNEFREETKTSIKLNRKGVPIIIEGDRNLLKTVFVNLFRNSVEAGASEISIETFKRMEQKEFEIKITDNGGGFSLEIKDKIFLPFFTTKERGTGMGLAFVKKIIASHQGRIIASSIEGKGSTFQIFLPIINMDS
jgi:PAS domain S-box-containing protein